METVTEHKSLNAACEPKLIAGVDLNANQNPNTGETNQIKGENIMNTQKENTDKETVDAINDNNNYDKGELIMGNNLINDDDSEYDWYVDKKDLNQYSIESFELARSQYYKLKPVIDIHRLRRVDIMHLLEMYEDDTRDENINLYTRKPIPENAIGTQRCYSCDECDDRPCETAWFSYPNRNTGNVLDFRQVDDISLYDFVVGEIYYQNKMRNNECTKEAMAKEIKEVSA